MTTSALQRFSFVVLGLLVFATCGRGASAPEWLRPLLSGEAAEWHPKEAVVTLLQRRDVRFLTVDRYVSVTRSALRANTTEGAQQLQIRLPFNADYQKITAVRAWIVSPKGKVVSVSRDAFTEQSGFTDSRYWNNYRVLTYNASAEADMGSVLAWEFAYEAPAPLGQCSWAVPLQRGLYQGEFSVVPPAHARLEWHSINPDVAPPQPGSAPGALTWRLAQIKPMRGAPPDGFCPQPFSIQVRCVTSETTPLDTAGWAELAEFQSRFYAEKAVVTKEIQAIADAETLGKKGRWDRVRALTHYVQKKVTYLAVTEDKDVFAGYRPHTAAEVAERKLGDCKDKVTLLMALLRAVGEDAIPTLVAAGMPAGVDPSWPANDFNHVIVALPGDSDVPAWWPTVKGPDQSVFVLFDPTARTLPLGCLPPSDQGGYVLLLAPKNGGLIHVTGDFPGLPPHQAKLAVALQSDGSAKINERYDAIGTDGAVAQSMLDGLSKEQVTRRLEKAIGERGATARKLTWSMDWDPTDVHFTLHTDFEVPQAARKIGATQLLFTPPFQKTRLGLAPWETSHHGLAYLPRLAFEEEIQLTLPEGTRIEELPTPLHLEQGGAVAEIAYTQDGPAVACRQHFVRPAAMYSKADYEKVRLLGEIITTAQRRPIILRLEQVAAAK